MIIRHLRNLDQVLVGRVLIRFVLPAFVLTSIAHVSAQTLRSSPTDGSNSSSDLSNVQTPQSMTMSFGMVSDGFSSAIDSSVALYNAQVGADSSGEYTANEGGASGGGARSMSYLAARTSTTGSTKIADRMYSSGASSWGGASEGLTSMGQTSAGSMSAGLRNAAALAGKAGLAVSVLPDAYGAISGMQATVSGARAAYSPSILPAGEEPLLAENPFAGENPSMTESKGQTDKHSSEFDQSVSAFNDGLEKIVGGFEPGEGSAVPPFKAQESLCSEFCGTAAGLSAGAGNEAVTAKRPAGTSRFGLSGPVDPADQLLNTLESGSAVRTGGTGGIQGGHSGAGGTLGSRE